MKEIPPAIAIAYLGSLVFWLMILTFVWFAGQRWDRLVDFRKRMIGQWKPALGIALVYAVGTMLRGTNANWFSALLGAVMTFCQAILGLALARGIADYDPLPVVGAIAKRERVTRSLILMIGLALLAVIAGFIAGALGSGMARALGEVKVSSSSDNSSMPALWQLFFHFLSGAGIAEETVYRLVIVSLFWKLTNRRWIAILVSGLLFGAYHLTPLSGMYLTFWQYPFTQFFSSAFIGMVWAYLYVKRGYETTVLAHTLSDWLPVAVFVLFFS